MDSIFFVSVTGEHNVQSVQYNRLLLLHKGLCVEMVAARITLNSGQESKGQMCMMLERTGGLSSCWSEQRLRVFYPKSDLIVRNLCRAACRHREAFSTNNPLEHVKGLGGHSLVRRPIGVSIYNYTCDSEEGEHYLNSLLYF